MAQSLLPERDQILLRREEERYATRKNVREIKEALGLNPEWNDFVSNDLKQYKNIINSTTFF